MVPTSHKILSPEAALEWRNGRKRVVFTNGVFDILHPGHVSVLEAARALGDVLIVGLNDGDSAARLGKGVGRPINSLEDRSLVVAALGAVDCVTSFWDDTPAALVELLQPDVLVKGGDYRGKEIPGAATVLAGGGEVIVLDYIEGYSTTQTLERMRDTI